MKQTTQNTSSDVIDLRELFSLLKRRKKLVWALTALFTIFALVYVFIAKPVYRGSVTIEVGQVAVEQFNEGRYSSLGIRDLDNVGNLQNIISKKFSINVLIPEETTLLTYTATNTNKDVIKEKLKKAVDYTLERHKEKAKLYSSLHSKVKMTQLIGDITVSDTDIKPKKKFIIIGAFITGLMLSIFLAFFLDFIKVFNKPIISEDQ